MKNFDDIFSRKVKEAFDSYNADHLAGEGWSSFAAKYGRKRNRAFVIPLWAKAATIAVMVTIGVLFIARINHRRVGESITQVAQESRSELTESAIDKENTATASRVTATANPVIAEVQQANTAANPVNTAPSRVIAASSPVSTAAQQAKTAANQVIAATNQANTTLNSAIVKPGQAAGTTVSKTGQIRYSGIEYPDDKIIVPAGSLLIEPVKTVGMYADMNLSENPIEIRLIDESGTGLKLKHKEALQVLDDIPRQKMTTTIMGGLSAMMASVGNATSSSQGVSIGFYLEQQLTRRISVRPGLAMAKHNYAMENMSGGSVSMDYAAPELNGVSGTTTSYEADIEVVSVEVPVNFVFSLWKRTRSNLFVTTGASTVVYLSQNMTGSFNNTYTRNTVDSYGEVFHESMTTSVKIESKQESLNRVDFLGLANFSAGYSIPFGKTSHLLFEPFVQLPVKDLTSLNLRIRYGGLSMKIQF